jgi:hypothetical protein
MDHVLCITEAARGKPVTFPYRDAMRLPIHVEDTSEIFVRVTLAEKTEHVVYNTGGETISMGDLAGLVKRYLPEAEISFENESGGRERSGNYMMDNSRLVQEFEYNLAPFEQRVLGSSTRYGRKRDCRWSPRVDSWQARTAGGPGRSSSDSARRGFDGRMSAWSVERRSERGSHRTEASVPTFISFSLSREPGLRPLTKSAFLVI